MDPNYLIVQPVEFGGVPRPRLLLKDVYVLYASQFRRWFGITAPLSLLAAAAILMADQKISSIYASIPRGEILHHSGEFAVAMALKFGSFFLSWFLGCFALAAIATVVNGLDVTMAVAFGRATVSNGRATILDRCC